MDDACLLCSAITYTFILMIPLFIFKIFWCFTRALGSFKVQVYDVFFAA